MPLRVLTYTLPTVYDDQRVVNAVKVPSLQISPWAVLLNWDCEPAVVPKNVCQKEKKKNQDENNNLLTC